jgi:hypothetical protein
MKSLISGLPPQHGPKFYPSFTKYIKETTSLSSFPSPVIVPWSKAWRLATPEFIDEPPSPAEGLPLHLGSPPCITYSSFGEYDVRALGISHQPTTTHVSWFLKTPIATTVSSAMAYCFVDPTPFMPEWGQRLMVLGHPPMLRVVTGRLQQRNNDVDIAFLHPLPTQQLNFDDVCDILRDFLNLQVRMPYQLIQPCPFG